MYILSQVFHVKVYPALLLVFLSMATAYELIRGPSLKAYGVELTVTLCLALQFALAKHSLG